MNVNKSHTTSMMQCYCDRSGKRLELEMIGERCRYMPPPSDADHSWNRFGGREVRPDLVTSA